jgi:hypothetical protein
MKEVEGQIYLMEPAKLSILASEQCQLLTFFHQSQGRSGLTTLWIGYLQVCKRNRLNLDRRPNQIAYSKPALVMETVSIVSQVIKASEKLLTVEMRMYNTSKTELKACFG